MIVTQEHQYIPYMKITEYHATVPRVKKAIVIDFKSESVELHKTKPGTSLLNVTPYDIPEDCIKEAIALFDRTTIIEALSNDNNQSLTSWFNVKFYDLEGHKQVFKVNPKDENHPIIEILRWIKKEYRGWEDIEHFGENL